MSDDKFIFKSVHPYIENRVTALSTCLYPKHHLWGIDSFIEDFKYDDLIKEKFKFPVFFNKACKKFFLTHFSPGISQEISCLLESYKSDIIYSVCGPLSLARLYGRAKLFSWVFNPRQSFGKNLLNPYHFKNLSTHTGFLCLTQKAADYYSQFAPAKFIPWCVDLEMFDGESSRVKPKMPFFLASGKTSRDYDTLIKAAPYTNAEIRIIGPKDQKPKIIPSNISWLDTSSDPPDQTIDYPTLKEWYAQCIAVCIPLSGDADDTCGYTNMLEAMAMRKPVLMTSSGCLHINSEKDGFGMQIKPRDAEGWAYAMNHLYRDHEKATEMGNRGREIAERDFTIERFNQDVLRFIQTTLNKK